MEMIDDDDETYTKIEAIGIVKPVELRREMPWIFLLPIKEQCSTKVLLEVQAYSTTRCVGVFKCWSSGVPRQVQPDNCSQASKKQG